MNIIENAAIAVFAAFFLVMSVLITVDTPERMAAKNACLMKGYTEYKQSDTHVFCIDNWRVKEIIPKKNIPTYRNNRSICK